VGEGVWVPAMGSDPPGDGYIDSMELVWRYAVCFHTDPDHLEAFDEDQVETGRGPLCGCGQSRMHRCAGGDDDDCWHCSKCGQTVPANLRKRKAN